MKSLRFFLAIITAFLVLSPFIKRTAFADDWPAPRHSPTRNAVSAEALPSGLPQVLWQHRPALEPSPAWYGPAKWDAYAELSGLHSMRDYDQVFNTVIADGAVFYASSSEECVRKLDADSGELEWTFFADGPIRVAPTYSRGKLFFGSDDGRAYCIDADTGTEIWRYAPRADGRKILNNGKLIPLWPIRTGVTVFENKAYFSASLLPWEPSLLCAVDTENGEEIYTHQVKNATIESPFVVSQRFLIAPQGRVPPLLFDRKTGKPLGQLGEGGGSFVVLVDEDTTMHGPGNKEGWIEESKVSSKEKIATHKQARAVVNTNGVSYFISDQSIFAIDYESKQKLWKADFLDPLCMIATKDAVIVGGVDIVSAYDNKQGNLLWEAKIPGRVKGLSFAGGRLHASVDTGEITCLSFSAEELPADLKVSSEQKRAQQTHQKWQASVDENSFQVAVGPTARFLTKDSVEIRWQTVQESPTVLTWIDPSDETLQFRDQASSTNHRVIVPNLGKNHVYHYKLSVETHDGIQTTSAFECDTFFNYNFAALPESSKVLDGHQQPQVEQIVDCIPSDSGIALILGASKNAWLAEEVARRTNLRLTVFDPDIDSVNALRKRLTADGLYGERITVRQASVQDLAKVTDHIATLVLSGRVCDKRESPYASEEFLRLLAPNGVALVPNKDLNEAENMTLVKGTPFEESGDWTHTYAAPDNSAFAGESLDHARTINDLAVQWIGRPGPRYQADRNGRKPSPLAANGRLFLQGLERIICLDAYNGAIVWSLETPYFHRFNMPRDCGNWCADDDALYAAIRDSCWKFDARTGELLERWQADTYKLPESESGYQWGYVGRSENVLLGTSVKSDAPWEDYWGGEGWFDKTEGPAVQQVASDRLIARDSVTGKKIWSHDGLVLNSSITVSEGAVYFAECRRDETSNSPERRLGGPEVWEHMYLTALDLNTGKERWSNSLKHITSGSVAFWLTCRDERLITVSSADVKFEVNAFSTLDGKKLWTGHADWGKGKADHGTHLSRPAIVGNRVVVRPAVFDLETGRKLDQEMPVSGCGTYACTTDALFFRAWSGQEFAVWSPESNEYTRWSRLRPDCWLSSIPACGLLLSPEGGGGCSCGKWLETSLAFIPKSRLTNPEPRISAAKTESNELD